MGTMLSTIRCQFITLLSFCLAPPRRMAFQPSNDDGWLRKLGATANWLATAYA
jgi:hypothetical protein